MITVEVVGPLVGPNHVLGPTDISNYAAIISLFTTTACTFSVIYDGVTYTGNIALSIDTVSLLVVFVSPPDIALPSGLCLQVECNPSVGAGNCPDIVCPNVLQTVTPATKLSVLAPDGCPIGFITVADLTAQILLGLNIPTSLCDLTGFPIPTGALVAADRVVTTQNGCDLKSVPQADITCP